MKRCHLSHHHLNGMHHMYRCKVHFATLRMQFCCVGKEFDKHIERLGGSRFLKRCDVDEVDGIETHIIPWKSKLFTTLESVVMSPHKKPSDSQDSSRSVSPSSSTLRRSESNFKLGHSSAFPLMAPVVRASWLTRDSGWSTDQRRVMHIELDVKSVSRLPSCGVLSLHTSHRHRFQPRPHLAPVNYNSPTTAPKTPTATPNRSHPFWVVTALSHRHPHASA